jgi:hypothetical protein
MATEQKSTGGVKGIFSKIMPFISAAAPLGGPAGVLAASVLGKVLGSTDNPAKVEPTANGIAAALSQISQDPVLIEKAREAEQQFQLQLKQLDIHSVEELEKLSADDRDSARKREVAVRDKMPGLLAGLSVVSLMFCICLIAFVHLPDGAKEALLLLIGFVGASYKDVYAYYFGSSAGSDRKTDLLAQAASQQP